MLYAGSTTVQGILFTFIQRICDYGLKLNLITDVLFEEALEEAK